ncbi:LppU/SCO3897 family protein [Streptomyces sp. NPDC001606]
MSSPTPPESKRPGMACLGVLGVIAFVVILLVVVNQGGNGDGASDDAGTSPSPYTLTSGPYTPSSEPSDAYSSDPYPSDPYSSDPYSSDPYSSPTPEPSPYTSGTCLNGTLPDSTTAQSVSGVDEVSCSASDAHYKVIETIPLTSDMSRCNANPRTQYAFSSRYTLNGATVNEYVYCLVGLGSYAR